MRDASHELIDYSFVRPLLFYPLFLSKRTFPRIPLTCCMTETKLALLARALIFFDVLAQW